ncbi:hypothetical protein QE152_g9144 [Popillia japonica]|uniref:Uncharacterized protein n=1 Tax=Popillia japonica TaxID=7064 RepID=A0AAW1M2M2_POPJA
MHFWIDKRSQGCGFNGRYLVPPSISGSRRRAGFCAGTYPKLMVTPVHRFQVLGGSEGFGRRVRTPSYRNHPRFFIHRPSSCQQDNASNNHNSTNPNVVSSVEQVNIARSVTLLPSRDNVSVTPRSINTPTTGLKCGVWAFFAMVTFFIAGAKFYFHGGTIGMEALAFCSFLILILIIGGLVSLYETVTSSRRMNQNAQISVQISTSSRRMNQNAQISVQISNDQNESSEEPSSQVPNSISPLNATEVSPPPYHVAIIISSAK